MTGEVEEFCSRAIIAVATAFVTCGHSSWGGGTILRLGHFATLRGTDVLEVGLGD